MGVRVIRTEEIPRHFQVYFQDYGILGILEHSIQKIVRWTVTKSRGRGELRLETESGGREMVIVEESNCILVHSAMYITEYCVYGVPHFDLI